LPGDRRRRYSRKPTADKAATPTDPGKLKWDRTFPPSDKVTHQKVSYPNRLGLGPAVRNCFALADCRRFDILDRM
jgi:hypothetical protein